jgi:hypothetical protein
VIGGARRHDAVPADVGGDDVRRDAVFGELPVILHAVTHDAELDGIQHAPAVGNTVEAVPCLAGVQHPAFRIGR